MNASRSKLTPPEIARAYGVSADKIRAWIRSGELRAVNIATKATGRPRYVIDQIDIDAFEHRRVARREQATRRRRSAPDVIEFF